MKHKIILLFLITFILATTVQAQKNKKCKLVHDKELDMDVYQDVDTPPMANENLLDSIMLSESFKFKPISKKYPEGQMVRIAYMIEKDGKPTLIKVLSPKGDKEIDAEAKRIVSLLPIHKPGMCAQEPVPCNGNINMRLYEQKK